MVKKNYEMFWEKTCKQTKLKIDIKIVFSYAFHVPSSFILQMLLKMFNTDINYNFYLYCIQVFNGIINSIMFFYITKVLILSFVFCLFFFDYCVSSSIFYYSVSSPRIKTFDKGLSLSSRETLMALSLKKNIFFAVSLNYCKNFQICFGFSL